jgi:CRISPR-associated endonuclease Cas1
MTSPVGIEAARMILRNKLHGQGAVLRRMGGAAAEQSVVRALDQLEAATSLDGLIAAESHAATAYWAAWAGLPVAFAAPDCDRVPEHWRSFGKRGSPLTQSPRLAISPANAVLNYLYALAEAESRFALFAVGLDPGIGIVHADQGARNSLALDLMEAARPAVDAHALELLRGRVFRASDFDETRRGVCRILPPITHDLATTCEQWRAEVSPVAERLSQMLLEGTAPLRRWARRSRKRTEVPAAPTIGSDPRRPQPRDAAPVPSLLPM